MRRIEIDQAECSHTWMTSTYLKENDQNNQVPLKITTETGINTDFDFCIYCGKLARLVV